MPANTDINEQEYWDMIDRELGEAEARKEMRYRKWTKQEKDLLRKYYNKVPVRVLCEKFDRTIGAVRVQAQRLGISEDASRKGETNE